METARWEKIEELLQAALDRDASERASFIATACGDDADLRRQLETLLSREEQARSFIETPLVVHLSAQTSETSNPCLIGRKIGHYRIESLIGAGGMGEVYKAEDENLRRTVALKVLSAEFVTDAERVLRFEREAFTVSRLNHPNIITIFEIARVDRQQFIVSEYIEGETLRQLLTVPETKEPRRLPANRALEIAMQVASALKAAHTAWIIHRDIKPENIMVRSDGVVKVLDFGIAKLGETGEVEAVNEAQSAGLRHRAVQPDARTSHTIPGAIMGTASYMSPEQARGDTLDGRTDVFSLGAVLYEMVSGKRLFDPNSTPVAGRHPVVTFERIGHLPRKLEQIIRRATRSPREERYASAGEMLADLTQLKQRLENRNIRRFARVSAIALILVLALAAISAWASRGEIWDERIMRDGHTAAVRRAVFSPDGRWLVSVSEDKQVIVWDFPRRVRVKTLTDHTAIVNAVAFSPDGKWFATGGDDETLIIWDAGRFEKVAVLHDDDGDKVLALQFSPDGRSLVTGYGGRRGSFAILREVGTWRKEREFFWGASYGNFMFLPDNRGLADNVGRIWNPSTGDLLTGEDLRRGGNWSAVSPDGNRWASISANGDVKLTDLQQSKILASVHGHHDHGRSVAFSPDGKILATAAERVVLWDGATLTRIAPLEYESIVWSVTFSPDGRWLVSTHGDGAILIWDVNQRERVADLREHGAGVRGVAFSPDGRLAASCGEDQSIIIWDGNLAHKKAVLIGHQTRVAAVAFSPDGKWLASADQDGVTIRWDLDRGMPQLIIRAPRAATSSYCVAISPDGRWIATTHSVYDSQSGQRVAELVREWGAAYGMAFTRDGSRLICTTDRGLAISFSTQTWQLVEQSQWSETSLVTMAISSDGQYIVTGDDGRNVRLGTVKQLKQLAVLGQHEARIKSVAFSPDGETVASGGDDKMIALWRVNRRKLIGRVGMHTSPVYAVAFSPDGRQLISGDHDRSVRLYARHATLWGFRLD